MHICGCHWLLVDIGRIGYVFGGYLDTGSISLEKAGRFAQVACLDRFCLVFLEKHRSHFNYGS